jgi:hypothetical protein
LTSVSCWKLRDTRRRRVFEPSRRTRAALPRSRDPADPPGDLERRRIVFAAYSGELVFPRLRQGIVTGQGSRPEEVMRFVTLRSKGLPISAMGQKSHAPQQQPCLRAAKREAEDE